MNEELARLYGTGASTGPGYDVDALEKMAQFALLSKEAAAAGVDLTQLTPEEQEYVLTEMQKTAAGPDPDNEARAKLEEADYIGRVIAHAFWQEKTAIEKQAATAEELRQGYEENLKRKALPTQKAPETTGRTAPKPTLVSSGARHPGTGKTQTELAAMRAEGELTGKVTPQAKPGDVSKATQFMHDVKQKATGAVDYATGAAKHYGGKVVELAKAHPGKAALIGAGLAAAGAGGAYAAGRAGREEGQRKAASAWDTLVDQRAYEILAANGLVREDGSVVPPYVEKQAEETNEFGALVDQTALNYLAQLGYQVG